MNNPRITAKDRGLIVGAIRRVFSRSELRRKIVDATKIQHFDPSRPRVKNWSQCPVCIKKVPTYCVQLDHVNPVIPVDRSLETMDWQEIVDRIFCPEHNLKAICKDCHLIKSKREMKERAINKRKNKK